MTKTFYIVGGILIVFLLIVVLLSWGSGGTAFAWAISSGGKTLLPLILIAAAVDSINPCAFSVLLLTVAFLFSLGRGRKEMLSLGGMYLLGLFLVYLTIGLGLLSAFHLFNTPHFMGRLGAILLLALGAYHLIAEYVPALPKLKMPHLAHARMGTLIARASLGAAFLLGALVGLCEFPCTGGPYLMALGLLHDSGTYLSGLAYLLIYNMIFIAPLILVLLLASDRGLLEKLQTWKTRNLRAARLWGGIAMVILALLILLL